MTNIEICNIPCLELETRDPFFDSIIETYPNYQKWLKESCFDRRCIIIKDSLGQFAGLCIYGFKYSDRYNMDGSPKNPIVKICSLKIREDLRRNRLATRIIQSIENEYCPISSKWIYTTVYPKCSDMIGFLESLGFIRHDSLKERTGEYVYVKRIHS